MECNICSSREFTDLSESRKGCMCKNCGSLERTRVLWMLLEKLNIKKDFKILHFAPEKGIFKRILDIVGEENYTTADIDPERYKFATCIKCDLTKLDHFFDNSFDVIIHNHVLEHIPCNIAYTLFHFHRILTKRGTHFFSFPILHGKYSEDQNDIGDIERERNFGQSDHVRKFGREDLNNQIGKILNMPDSYNLLNFFRAEQLLHANVPKFCWENKTSHSIFSLKKEDYLLNFNN